MSMQDSAYAALGLRPGARRSEVDQAYRRLIKLYHPDRTGGDGHRAAEINRAYTLLRRSGLAATPRPQRMPMPVPRPRRAGRPRFRWAMLAALAAVAAGGFAAMDKRGAIGRATDRMAIRLPVSETIPLARFSSPVTSFDEPLNLQVIDTAIANAVEFHEAGDPGGAGEFSRQCQVKLRQQPNLARFDACSAFDEATVTLLGDEVVADSGSFDISAVVVRELGAARLLSGDAAGAEFRIHRIRSRVEMALLPRLDPAAGARP